MGIFPLDRSSRPGVFFVRMVEQMIRLMELEEVIETTFLSPWVPESIPLSLVLVGASGTGKSKVLLQYHSPSVHRTNDITTAGLAELMQDDKESKIRHILIPDFNLVMSHRPATTTLTVASLLSLMSEGIMRIDDGRVKKDVVHAPIGLITAMTRDIYEESASRFRKLGLSRRFIPIFYSYSILTRELIQNEIKKGRVTLRQLQAKQITMPKEIRFVGLNAISERIAILSRDFADALAMSPAWIRNPHEGTWKVTPQRGVVPIEFTPHMILRAMARAHALRARKKQADGKDFEFLTRFVNFTNYACPVQL